MTTNLLGAFYALLAAALYGGADFSGGFAARRLNQFQVLFLSALVGAVVLVALSLLWKEGLPTPRSAFFAALSGIFGSLGLSTLYYALAFGRAGVVAPASAVVASAVPVLYTAIVEGLPGAVTLVGFILAAAGIWLVTRTEIMDRNLPGNGLKHGLLAGLGFGLFFVFIANIEPGPVFSPLVFGKLASVAVGLTILAVMKVPLPRPVQNPFALLAGLLDGLATVLYLLSTTLTRVDIAAVLVCIYPAFTVLLAVLYFREPINRTQGLGVLVCLVAVILIVA